MGGFPPSPFESCKPFPLLYLIVCPLVKAISQRVAGGGRNGGPVCVFSHGLTLKSSSKGVNETIGGQLFWEHALWGAINCVESVPVDECGLISISRDDKCQ